MQLHAGRVLVSASDLVGFHDCEHLTYLDRRALDDPALRARKVEADEHGQLIQKKGVEHEQRYLAKLEAEHKVVHISKDKGRIEDRVDETRAAMRAGAPFIYQGAFLHGDRVGYADFLRKVENGYEVIDTKLARSEKASFVLQLCYYTDLLAKAQGTEPRSMHVALGDGSEISYRYADYSRYVRRLGERFDTAVLQAGKIQPDLLDGAATYPYKVERCDYCQWRQVCEEQRERDDHVMLVAGIRRDQVRKLERAGIRTLRALAGLPADERPSELREQTFAKLQSQAAMQLRGREAGKALAEAIAWPDIELRGFKRLPAPDPDGDVYFDMEGDPHVEDGLEYLFGVVAREKGKPVFKGWWAHTRDEERAAFGEFMDWLDARLRAHPNAHVYHYAAYEPTAIKRLASLHATREAFLDDLLRGKKLVDLYATMREAFRVSTSSYGLKHIEALYSRTRAGGVQTAGESVVAYEKYLETHDAALLEKIADYNRDDCESLAELHAWLLAQRPRELPWFTAADANGGEPPKPLSPARLAEDAETAALRARLLAGEPDPTRELVAQLLDFHRRADKPQYWEMFDRQKKEYEELIDDTEAIEGLKLVGRVQGARGNLPRFEYEYPEQDFKLRAGDQCCRLDNLEPVTIESIDEDQQRIVIYGGSLGPNPPVQLSIGAGRPHDSKVLREAVRRYGAAFAAGADRYRALTALLRKEVPRIRGLRAGAPIVPEDAPLDRSIDAVERLQDSYLFIQGPPGAGKTYTGAHLIIALLKKGKRVAVSSNSHKAINNLLRCVEEQAEKQNFVVRGVKKGNTDEDNSALNGRMIRDTDDNAVALSAEGVVGGTAWLFARPDADQRFDYLFVDEAGQVSLGHLVAMATCAKNIVLLGDQMQLGNPTQGVHPGRSGDSTLEYLLDNAATVPPDRGIFLPITWRMHPDLCAFISEAIYDGRLRSHESCAKQRLVLAPDAHPALRPTGLVVVPAEHAGCSQKSEAEAKVVLDLYKSLLRQQWVDRHGRQRAVTPEDILVVAPYNVQVNLLRRTLPAGARVGTVDRFQGQEAAGTLVSMTTSTQEELPRNIEFLFSRNRLNVALSRARCTSLLIASPKLVGVVSRTADETSLVNTLAWAHEYVGSINGVIRSARSRLAVVSAARN